MGICHCCREMNVVLVHCVCVETILNNVHTIKLKVLNFSAMQLINLSCVFIVSFINLKVF
jgi:hypothetical protein